MKPFDIFMWQAAGWPEPHPAVVVSHADRAARKDPVEVLLCATKRATRKAEPHEVVLDQADGLDWETLCKCDVIYAVPRPDLERKPAKGRVTPERQAQLVRTILAAHGWGAIL
jgi:mRNA-degrading endonuclease toxin of MazEF toxin-antitoxin module